MIILDMFINLKNLTDYQASVYVLTVASFCTASSEAPNDARPIS